MKAEEINSTELMPHLERVLRSRVFEKAQRSQRFLRYIVQAALDDDELAVKEYTVALRVFDRDDSYDPSNDATVRVEASRLRSRLREYYGGEGRHDLLIIEVPKGGYRVAFVRRAGPLAEQPAAMDPAAGEAGNIPAPPDRISDPAVSNSLRRAGRQSSWIMVATAMALLAMAGIAVYSRLHARPARLVYTQLTDFTDSATAPALSPDGHMLAFIRGSAAFLTADQIYIKVLPGGEARRLTNDPRLKYHVAFSPDGSQIAYTAVQAPRYSTYAVSILGGDSHLLLNNAAGLTWLDPRQLLFSEIRSGLHMGVVTETITREHFRELYFPNHERGMAHYSYASPDHKSALVVEMNGQGRWDLCRLISLDGSFQSRSVGPAGACRSAGWSPDGMWMYFTAAVSGQSHLWRQRFPQGEPEQITVGPTEEDGIAVERDGRSVITSMGVRESAIWIHDTNGDRSLSSEGEVVTGTSPPAFSPNGKTLYYLLRRQSMAAGPELWRMLVDSGRSEAVFPGVSMLSWDLSPDGEWVVYSRANPAGTSQLWLGAVDGSSPPRQIGRGGEVWPHFGPRGKILFQLAEGKFNYLERMNQDGSAREKILDYPIGDLQSMSPARRWILADIPFRDQELAANVAIPVDGGPPKRLCAEYCKPKWSPDGRLIYIPVEPQTRTSPGRSLAIPTGSDESLPEFPEGGIKAHSTEDVVPGSHSVDRADLVPGNDIDHFAYVNTNVHRNIYRITLP